MIENVLYQEDLKQINELDIPWECLRGKSVLITGASGLIGSVITDVFIYRNEHFKAEMELWLLGRSEKQFSLRYKAYADKSYMHFLVQDVCDPIHLNGNVDYIIHAASKGDPASFARDPVGIMNSNYMGMYQVLELAKEKRSVRVLYISSGEVYGIVDNDDTQELKIKEEEYGYVDILSSRSGYSSSKRAAETLCISHAEQFGTNVVIARLCHTYGATMQNNDNRVIGEFIRNAVSGKNIVMRSPGLQRRSYCYVADAVSALLFILLKGIRSEAYNIANGNESITIRELAELSAQIAGTSVIFEAPDMLDIKNSSNINRAILHSGKLEDMGWSPYYGVAEGMKRTIDILKSIK